MKETDEQGKESLVFAKSDIERGQKIMKGTPRAERKTIWKKSK